MLQKEGKYRSFGIINVKPEQQNKIIKILENIKSQKSIKDKIRDIWNYDTDTYVHSEQVAIISLLIGMEQAFSKDSLKDLAVSALLHDFGKVKVPIEIINKPGAIDVVEREIIEAHPALGEYYLRNCGFSKAVLSGIYEHHESFIGSERGYPRHLVGEEIHLFGRIIAVADKIDAYTAKRIYHDERSLDELKEFISKNEDLDQQIVKIVMQRIK